jgi:hypothetical protein
MYVPKDGSGQREDGNGDNQSYNKLPTHPGHLRPLDRYRAAASAVSEPIRVSSAPTPFLLQTGPRWLTQDRGTTKGGIQVVEDMRKSKHRPAVLVRAKKRGKRDSSTGPERSHFTLTHALPYLYLKTNTSPVQTLPFAYLIFERIDLGRYA